MKEKYKVMIMFIFIVVIFAVSLVVVNNNQTISTSVSVANSKVIGWGIKRANNNMQPDVGADNRKMLEENGGICLGKDTEKVIYLTFDEGYEAGYTEKILKTLKENDIKATFFITAHYLNTHPELVKRMIEEGHDVGNHTVNHKSMPEITEAEIKKEVMDLHTAVYEKFGYEMKYIRPPKGEYSEKTLQICNEMNYQTVMWSFAYDDWEESKQGREEYGKEKILKNLHPGEVMLLHGTSKDNMNILSECIQMIKKEGYEFRKLEEFYR